MNVVKRALGRDDVAVVVNACDAGREGELIFAYLYEKAGSRLPVQRLWLSSMTKAAIEDAFGRLRPGEELRSLEDAARSRSEADWIVGMNATRAATIRLRSSFDGAVSLGPRADADARDPRAPRGGDPRLQTRSRTGSSTRRSTAERSASVRGPLSTPARSRASRSARGGGGDRRRLPRRRRRHLEAGEVDAQRARAAAVRPHLAAARRELALRLLRAPHARGRAALYEEHKALTYPRTSSRYLPSDMIPEIKPIAGDRRPAARVRRGRALRDRPRHAAARPRGQQREGHRPPRDHPDERARTRSTS